MRYVALAALILSTLGAVSANPVFVCHYSKATNRLSGDWEGGFPTHLAMQVRLKGFYDMPAIVYNARLVPRCNIVFDADQPLVNGSYTKTVCAPLGEATVPGTPACGNWKP